MGSIDTSPPPQTLTIGVLALQGGFAEHLSSLRRAAAELTRPGTTGSGAGQHSNSQQQSGAGPGGDHLSGRRGTHSFSFIEVKTPEQLASCEGLVIPGGESTTLSLVAEQSGLLGPLREFVKTQRRPTWGTCAGLIFLCEEASSTKRGGQELIGGLDVRVHRNHFGRQIESFVTKLDLPFLNDENDPNENGTAFPAVFIRAPVVECLLPGDSAASRASSIEKGDPQPRPVVEILAVLPGRHKANEKKALAQRADGEETAVEVPEEGPGDIVALRQGNVFGMSFHPELTEDVRIHKWWLRQVVDAVAVR